MLGPVFGIFSIPILGNKNERRESIAFLLCLQAAGFTFDESLGRVIPEGTEREAKEAGGTDIHPAQVCTERERLHSNYAPCTCV